MNESTSEINEKDELSGYNNSINKDQLANYQTLEA